MHFRKSIVLKTGQQVLVIKVFSYVGRSTVTYILREIMISLRLLQIASNHHGHIFCSCIHTPHNDRVAYRYLNEIRKLWTFFCKNMEWNDDVSTMTIKKRGMKTTKYNWSNNTTFKFGKLLLFITIMSISVCKLNKFCRLRCLCVDPIIQSILNAF